MASYATPSAATAASSPATTAANTRVSRYDIPAESKQSIADAVRSGNVRFAVDLANRLIWVPFTAGAGWVPLASEEQINRLLSTRPKILKSLPAEVVAQLNFACIMGNLLGPQYREREWLDQSLRLAIPMNLSAAVRMFDFCERHHDQLSVYANAAFKTVKILGCRNIGQPSTSCALCDTLHDTVWDVGELPELPHENCTNILGCRCTAMVPL